MVSALSANSTPSFGQGCDSSFSGPLFGPFEKPLYCLGAGPSPSSDACPQAPAEASPPRPGDQVTSPTNGQGFEGMGESPSVIGAPVGSATGNLDGFRFGELDLSKLNILDFCLKMGITVEDLKRVSVAKASPEGQRNNVNKDKEIGESMTARAKDHQHSECAVKGSTEGEGSRSRDPVSQKQNETSPEASKGAKTDKVEQHVKDKFDSGPATNSLHQKGYSSREGNRSYKHVVVSEGKETTMSVNFFPPSVVNGKIQIVPPKDILDKGADVWAACIVGRFVQRKPPVQVVKEAAHRLWGNMGLELVIFTKPDVFKFLFKTVEDRDKVLAMGPWHLANKTIVLKKWAEDVSFEEAGLKSIPVWVKFYSIPDLYWSAEGISYIASGVGKPLYVDNMTARLGIFNFARVCIDISADLEFPSSLEVLVSDGKFKTVEVEYEAKPPVCPLCRIFGHTLPLCPNAKHHSDVPEPTEAPVVDNRTTKAGTSTSQQPKVTPSKASVGEAGQWREVLNRDGQVTKRDKGKSVCIGEASVQVSPAAQNPFQVLLEVEEVEQGEIVGTPVQLDKGMDPSSASQKGNHSVQRAVGEKENRDTKNLRKNATSSGNSTGSGGRKKKRKGRHYY